MEDKIHGMKGKETAFYTHLTLNQNNVFPLEPQIHGMKGKEIVFLHPVNHNGYIRDERKG